jgi:hypothetical protein
MNMKKVMAIIFYFGLIVLATFIILEVIAALLLAFPSRAVKVLGDVGKRIYMEEYVSIIQYEAQCAKYDPQVTYTLRPGRCSFNNSEFKTQYLINSLGLRDDEDSLNKPQIIVLGDSVAMGWGVEQDQTFAEIIQKRTGMKVLNAAISSYGTVREMMSLDRFDTSAMKYLIVCYSWNDSWENQSYFDRNNSLHITSRADYEKIVREYLNKKRYFPGKYVRYVLGKVYRNVLKMKEYAAGLGAVKKAGMPQARSSHDLTVKYFLNAFMNASHVNLDEFRILVTSCDVNFIADLKGEIARGGYPEYIKSMVLVPVTPSPAYYFILDGHHRVEGHEIFANEILRAMGH